MFTGDQFADGADTIIKTLAAHNAKGGFFFTGRFYDNPAFKPIVRRLVREGHYFGPHSDQHLLYCDWNNRDSLLVSKHAFSKDLETNTRKMLAAGIKRKAIKYFIPPFEWYNDSIAAWTREQGLTLINFSPGTKITADYTWPALKNYRSSEEIFKSIRDKEAADPNGLNGFILLIHIGTDPSRTDKFYLRLPQLMGELKQKGYQFVTVNELLN